MDWIVEQLGRTTKTYRVMMLVLFVVSVSINGLFMRTLIDQGGSFTFTGLVIRSVVEGLLFLLICHVFLRTYIKAKVLDKPLNRWLIFKSICYLLLVAIGHFSLTQLMGSVPALGSTSIESVQVFNESGQLIDAEFDYVLINVLGVLPNFFLLLGWSLIYIFWKLSVIRQRLQMQLHQAQFQQLTNQLSPHFLFNTFNSIRALIFENPNLAADTITHLSELFRTHLQSDLKNSVSLAEELVVCRQYVSIEQLRLEERLLIEYEIDADLMNQKLPALSLLTLIENAIKHGIVPNSTPGQVNIKATAMPNKSWRLMVSNSLGNEGAKIGKIDGTGTGLTNLSSRLKLMYGASHQFTCNNSSEAFVVVMELPYV